MYKNFSESIFNSILIALHTDDIVLLEDSFELLTEEDIIELYKLHGKNYVDNIFSEATSILSYLK